MNINDRDLLAKTLMAEAGNQGFGGMLAAGSVIMNRAGGSGYGDGIRNVILKPGQFSAWNSLTGYAGGEQGQDMAAMRPSAEAYQAADKLLAGDYQDPTGGATHYYNPAISNPKWGRDRAGGNWKQIGDHIFGFADANRKPNPNQAVADDTMQALGVQPQGILAPTQTSETESKPMMNQQKPRGLLEGIGIQKMEEGAEGETGQRFYQRDSFKDTAAVLAQGFGRMGIMGMEEIADGIAKQRTESKAKNKTIEAIGKMGTPQSQAALEYIQAGGDPVSALKMAFAKPDATKGVVMGDRLINPMTGEVMADFDSGAGFEAKDVVAARKEFTGQKFVKDFSDQTAAYGRILASVEDPSPSGDLALIFNFMKVLDPGSTVREGEFATAAQAGKVDDRVRNLYNRVTMGEKLTKAQRDDFAGRATNLYSGAEEQYKYQSNQYAGFAEAAGLPVDQVIPDFSYSGDRYKSPLEFRRPATPAGKNEAEWASAWESMTDKDRQEFIDAGQF